MKKNVIVVGGAGFIGSHLTDTLVREGYLVHVVDDLSAGKKENVSQEATLHTVDILDYSKLSALFLSIPDIHCVFHLAALPRVQYSIEHPIETNRVNVEGTVNVLHAATAAKARRLIYSASSAAYGDQVIMPLREDMPGNPKSPYGLQKYIGEQYCRVWNMVYGLETVSLRYFNVYGPRMALAGAYSLVIGLFLDQRKRGEPMTITGDGLQTRDFTHVRDIVRANILAMESPQVGKSEVINIGAGRNIAVKKIAELIGGEAVHIPARLEPKNTLADNSLAQKLIGWVPTISIEEGIDELKKIAGL